jgi:hypothetical protein
MGGPGFEDGVVVGGFGTVAPAVEHAEHDRTALRDESGHLPEYRRATRARVAAGEGRQAKLL